jgi:hypothetical protein
MRVGGIAMIVLLSSLAAPAKAAETVEIIAAQDAYICDCKPDSTNPNGGPDYIYHGQYGGCYDRTLIEWDLSSLPSGILIVSAEMRLFCEAFWGSQSGEPVYYMINEPWSELSVTYNTQPDYDTSQQIAGYWPEADTWYEVDVTDYVAAWVAGAHVNHGIYCFCQGTTGTCVPGFWSKDYAHSELHPRLVITYEITDLDQASWGEVKTECDGEEPTCCGPPRTLR